MSELAMGWVVYTEKVTGSSPVAPTKEIRHFLSIAQCTAWYDCT